MHHRLHVITGEAQLVSEKERTDKRQLFKLGKSDGIFQQLPLRLQGVKLVNELLGVCQEVVVVVLVPVKAKLISKMSFHDLEQCTLSCLIWPCQAWALLWH